MSNTAPKSPDAMLASGCLRIADFLVWAGISKTKAYEEVKAGRLRMVKCGKRSLIRVEDALRWRDALPAMHEAPRAGDRQPGTRRAKLSVVSAGCRS